MFSIITVYSILIIFLARCYSSIIYILLSVFSSYSLQSMLYAPQSTIYPLGPSTLYVLPATVFDLRSMLYNLSSTL